MDEEDGQATANNEPQNNTVTEQTNTTLNNSYSNALIQQRYPKKDQAIIFPSINGVKLQEYLFAIGPLVNPRNILFSSRISNNRICIYLSNKETVDKFMNEQGSITVNAERLQARRLVTPAERLIISNVCPTIPHSTLELSLRDMGVTLLSPMTYLRIGVTNPEYNHILSFRRQIYVKPLEGRILPESMLITHDNTSYRVFLTQDNLSCFKCKQQGHIASQCPNETNNTTTNINRNTTQNEDLMNFTEPTNTSLATSCSQQTTEPLNTVSLQKQAITNSPQHTPKNCLNNSLQNATEPSIQSTSNPTPNSTSLKRLISPPSSPDPDKVTNSESVSQKQLPKPNAKKCKTINPPEDSTTRKLIEEQSPPFVLNYEQLKDFLENASNSPDPVSIATEYTQNVTGLLDMINKIQPSLENKTLKTKCTKIKKKIIQQLIGQTESSPPESDNDTTPENQ